MPNNEHETPTRKYADRFKAESVEGYLAELEKSYGEAEGKISTQGTSASELQKKFDALTQQHATVTQQAQQMQQSIAKNQPLVEWYESPAGKQWLENAKQNEASVQQTQIPLSAAELEAMSPGIGNWVEKNLLAPREQQYGKYIKDELQKQETRLTEQFQDQTRRTNNAMYELMKSGLPEDRVEVMEKFSERIMKHADPSTQDPAQMARDSLAQDAQIASMESQLSEYKKEKEAASQYEGMPLGDTASADDLAAFSSNDESQMSDREVRQAVFAEVDKAHGQGTIQRMGNAMHQ